MLISEIISELRAYRLEETELRDRRAQIQEVLDANQCVGART